MLTPTVFRSIIFASNPLFTRLTRTTLLPAFMQAMSDYKMTPGLRATHGVLGTVFSLRMLGVFMVLPVLTGMALQGRQRNLIISVRSVFWAGAGYLSEIPLGCPTALCGVNAVSADWRYLSRARHCRALPSIWGIVWGRRRYGVPALLLPPPCWRSCLTSLHLTYFKRWRLSASALVSPRRCRDGIRADRYP